MRKCTVVTLIVLAINVALATLLYRYCTRDPVPFEYNPCVERAYHYLRRPPGRVMNSRAWHAANNAAINATCVEILACKMLTVSDEMEAQRQVWKNIVHMVQEDPNTWVWERTNRIVLASYLKWDCECIWPTKRKDCENRIPEYMFKKET